MSNELTGMDFPPKSGTDKILIRRIIDGDTVEFYYLIPATGRLHGINTPEIHGEDSKRGEAAKEYLKSLLTTGLTQAAFHGTDKYGRILIELFDAEGKSINQHLIDNGMAKPYDGKGPKPT